MMWRHLVQQWIQQSAQQKMLGMVAEAQRAAQYRFADPEVQAAFAREQRCEIAVLFALGVEAGGTVDLLQNAVSMRCPNFVEHAGELGGRRVALVETGTGRQAAAAAAEDVIALHRPGWIISAGFAGGLRAGLRHGHIVMVDVVLDTAQRQFSLGLHIGLEALKSSPALHVGPLLTVDRLARTVAEKRQLSESCSALACDMETLAVVEICQREKVRCLAIRIITDTLEEEIPKEVERLLDQKSLAARLGAATGALLNRPSSLKDMWQLKEEALKASDRLGRFLVGVIGQLDPRLPLDSSPGG
jgi:adenosylhomocysteine nucleosidase